MYYFKLREKTFTTKNLLSVICITFKQFIKKSPQLVFLLLNKFGKILLAKEKNEIGKILLHIGSNLKLDTHIQALNLIWPTMYV